MRSYQIKMKNQSQKDKFKKIFNINWMQYTETFQIRENISVKNAKLREEIKAKNIFTIISLKRKKLQDNLQSTQISVKKQIK